MVGTTGTYQDRGYQARKEDKKIIVPTRIPGGIYAKGELEKAQKLSKEGKSFTKTGRGIVTETNKEPSSQTTTSNKTTTTSEPNVVVAYHPDIKGEQAKQLLEIVKRTGKPINITDTPTGHEITYYEKPRESQREIFPGSNLYPEAKTRPEAQMIMLNELIAGKKRTEVSAEQVFKVFLPGKEKIVQIEQQRNIGVEVPGGAGGILIRGREKFSSFEKKFINIAPSSEGAKKFEQSKVGKLIYPEGAYAESGSGGVPYSKEEYLNFGTYFVPVYGEAKFGLDIGSSAQRGRWGEALALSSIPYLGLAFGKSYSHYKTKKIIKNAEVVGEPSFVTKRFYPETGEVVEKSIGIVPVKYAEKDFFVRVKSEGVAKPNIRFGEPSFVGSDISKVTVFERVGKKIKVVGEGDFKSAYELVGIDKPGEVFGRVDYVSNLGVRSSKKVVQGRGTLFGENLLGESGDVIGQKVYFRGLESKPTRGEIDVLKFGKKPKYVTGFEETGISTKILDIGKNVEFFKYDNVYNLGIKVPRSEVFVYSGESKAFLVKSRISEKVDVYKDLFKQELKSGLKSSNPLVVFYEKGKSIYKPSQDFFYFVKQPKGVKLKPGEFEYLRTTKAEPTPLSKPSSQEQISESVSVSKISSSDIKPLLSKRIAKQSVVEVLSGDVKPLVFKNVNLSSNKLFQGNKFSSVSSFVSGFRQEEGLRFQKNLKFESGLKFEQGLKFQQDLKFEQGLKFQQDLKFEQGLKFQQNLKFEQMITPKKPRIPEQRIYYPTLPLYLKTKKKKGFEKNKEKKKKISLKAKKYDVYVLPDLLSVELTERKYAWTTQQQAIAPRLTPGVERLARASFGGYGGFIPTEQIRRGKIRI